MQGILRLLIVQSIESLHTHTHTHTHTPDARRMKEYERQKQRHEDEQVELSSAETRSKVAKFLSTEKSIVSKPINPFSAETSDTGSHDQPMASNKGQSTSSNGSGSSDEPKSKLPSFWVPSLTPAAKPTEIKKPVSCLS